MVLTHSKYISCSYNKWVVEKFSKITLLHIIILGPRLHWLYSLQHVAFKTDSHSIHWKEKKMEEHHMARFYGLGSGVAHVCSAHILLARTQSHGHLTAKEPGKCSLWPDNPFLAVTPFHGGGCADFCWTLSGPSFIIIIILFLRTIFCIQYLQRSVLYYLM